MFHLSGKNLRGGTMRTPVWSIILIMSVLVVLTGCSAKSEFMNRWQDFLDDEESFKKGDLLYIKKRQEPTGELSIQRVIIPQSSLHTNNQDIFALIGMMSRTEDLLEIKKIADSEFKFTVSKGIALKMGTQKLYLDADSICEMDFRRPKRLTFVSSQPKLDSPVFISFEYKWGERERVWIPINVEVQCSNYRDGIERITREAWTLVKTFQPKAREEFMLNEDTD